MRITALEEPSEVEVLGQRWEEFHQGKAVTGVRKAVYNSWLRCARSCVRAEFEQRYNQKLIELQRNNEGLLTLAYPYLELLALSFGQTPGAAILTDSSGTVLEMVCTKAFLPQVEQVGLTVGFSCLEQVAGTNSVALALRSKRISFVIGPEHYSKEFHQFATLAAPLRAAGRAQPLGTVSIWLPLAKADTLRATLYYVSTVTFSIEQAMEKGINSSYSLAAATSHELRNPLTSIRLLAQQGVIRSSGDVAARNFEKIVEQVDRMQRILTNLALLEKPRHSGAFALVSLEKVLPQAIELIPDKHGVRIECHGLCDLPLIPANVDLITQAFLNIISNAVEAVQSSCCEGKVSIQGEFLEACAQVRITVRDTGPGIEQEQLQKIFKPYFSTKEKGTGLGLAITRKIISRIHNGDVSVQSWPGKGTLFTIRLPLAPRVVGG